MLSPFNDPDEPLSFKQKLQRLNWFIPFNMAVIATIGAFMLYSAANGNIDPWASKHIVRFAIGLCLMIGLAFLPAKFWYHISYPAFIASIMLLVWVDLSGHVGMGAQRWMRLFGVALQPSEVTKITLLLALSRYFHDISNENNLKITEAIPAMLMIIVPVGLILKQPDLGTALMLVMAGVACLFLAGLAKRWFFMAGGAVLAFTPIAFNFLLHDYQKRRIMTFLNPESDPLGSGYHILQSKVALGSGGIYGKGFGKGSQSQLDFLPEKHTDFIFTMLTEEFGFIGSILLIMLYLILIYSTYFTAMRCKNIFSRLFIANLAITVSLYVIINTGMVTGLLPVVGVPLPFVSYGGTVMLSLMGGYAIMLSLSIHRDKTL